MGVPFSIDQFFGVIGQYNRAVAPVQWLLVALALATVAVSFRRQAIAGRLVLSALAFLWLWMGAVFHLAFFARINPAARAFGVVFIIEAGLLAWVASRGTVPSFRPRWNVAGVTGGILLGYALAGYPLIGLLAGERYPALPTFGLPCPTTIFTFGLLLWTSPRARWSLAVIPLLWAALGWSAARQLGVVEDYGLLIAGVVTVALLTLAALRRAPAVSSGARKGEIVGAGRV